MSFRTVDYDHFRSACVPDTGDTDPWWRAPLEALASVHVRGGWVRAPQRTGAQRTVDLRPPADRDGFDRAVLPHGCRDWDETVFPTAAPTADLGAVSLGEAWMWTRGREGAPRVVLHRRAPGSMDISSTEFVSWIPAAAIAAAELFELLGQRHILPHLWALPRREWNALAATLYVVGPQMAYAADVERLGVASLLAELERAAAARRAGSGT